MSPSQRTVVFNVGDEVEVCCKEEGLYYEATIVSILDDGRYEVQYKTLVEDKETKIPMKDALFPKDLRPKPPCIPTPRYLKLHQYVNVFDDDAWRIGRITGKKDSEAGPFYFMHFSSSDESTGYHSSVIRVHHEFFYGQWFQMTTGLLL